MRSCHKPSVLCLSLAPAVQRTLAFARFQPGEVNRARECVVSVGGKAVNTGLALARLRRACVVTGLNGGDTGRFVARYLAAHGVTCAFTRVPDATRTCTTILDHATGETTELVEEVRRPAPRFLRRFVVQGARLLRQADALVICGTLSSGLPTEIWAQLAAAARRQDVPVILDSHGEPLLQALAHAPQLAKLNVRELEKTFGRACRTPAQIVAGARRLVAGGAQWALVTHGAQPATLVGRAGEAWQVTPPAVKVLSPIGSGDCVNAGIADALLRGETLLEAVRFGLGCGSANARTHRPADFSAADARRLAKRCRVKRLRLA
jgi:tagatose 6-phosphate kinase